MTLQSELNLQSLDLLPDVQVVILGAEPFEAEQMHNRAIKAINASKKSLDKMSICEICEIQQMLFMAFRFHGWTEKEL